MTTRVPVLIHPIPRELGGVGIRTFADLIDALVEIEELAGQVLTEDEPLDDRALEQLQLTAALVGDREIVALRLEREPDTLTFHAVLLTEEDL